jgi:hypothetical protein
LNEVTNQATEQKNSKQCRHCKQVKPTTEFYKNSMSKDGLHIWCISCFKEYDKKRIGRKRNKKINPNNTSASKAKKYREKKKAIIESVALKVPNFTLEGDPNKCLIQRFLLLNSKVSGSAIMMPSFSPNKSITNYLDYIYDKNSKDNYLHLVEKNDKIYQTLISNLNKVDKIPSNLEIKTIYSNIAYIKDIPNLVEVDLMCSSTNAIPIFKILFMKMNNNSGNLALIGTYSTRNCYGESSNLINVLEKITDWSIWRQNYEVDEIPMIRILSRDSLKRTDYLGYWIGGNKYLCTSFNYNFNNGGNMTTFMIKWKNK